MSAGSLSVLLQVFRRESSSLPVYLADAAVWVGRSDVALGDQIQSIIVESHEWQRKLFDMILDRGSVPRAGIFPAEFTDAQFLSLRYLLGRLVREYRQSITALEKDLADLVDDAEARRLVAHILERQRDHLRAFDTLTATTATAAPTTAAPAATTEPAH